MTVDLLEKLFLHNTWANLQVIDACAKLTDAQLDAEPQSATRGSIRTTLVHLIYSEQDYYAQLARKQMGYDWPTPPSLVELRQAAVETGEDFLTLVQAADNKLFDNHIFESDGYVVEPWVVVVQAINHAGEHREQIKSMLTILGAKPPRVDGWGYGRLMKAVIPPAQS